jgi:hypothetical protein
MTELPVAPTDLELLHGVDVEPSIGRLLRAGPVEAVLLDGDLRYVRRDGTEVARRIQVAVRSAAWDTVPGERAEELIEQGPDSFRVSFDSLHRYGELWFRWRCVIEGAPDGTITYAMEGLAERDFEYRRIGLCVLHPTDVFAGGHFEAHSPSARSVGTLPATVGPQPFDGESYPPLFDAFDRLRMRSRSGLAVEFGFEGDLFEMEDQRNWTDASFKTYGRNPLARPEPWALRAGTQVRQRVTISTDVAGPAGRGRPRPPVVTLGDTVIGRVPALGVALAADEPAHGRREIARLRRIGLAHLRVDVHLRHQQWGDLLERGVALARELDCALELAVFAAEGGSPSDAASLGDVAHRLAQPDAPAVARLMMFADDSEVTPPDLVDLARATVGSSIAGVPIGGGTNVYFAELNREDGFPPAFEVLAYPITPQVHSDDDLSLVETPMAQADTVRRAHLLAPEASIAVTPITLKPRFNPDALDAPTAPDVLPANVDVRQTAQIAAAWTLASVRRLGEAGAASATYFETVGWRGLLEPDSLPPRTSPFPSVAGMLFPVYHLLAELAPLSEFELLECATSRPLELEAIQIAGPSDITALVANLLPRRATVELTPIPAGARIRRINTDTTRRQMSTAALGGERWDPVEAGRAGTLELDLSGYEVSVLRWPR